MWLAGSGLRITVLAVPPVLPAIHRTLHLDEAAIGALSGLPVLLLSAGAVFGSLLVARLGARRALISGLSLLALAGALRGAGQNTGILFLMTFAMGVGIAVSQPALPSLVRAWFPAHSALATATYSNGFLIGETLAAALTVPLIFPLLDQRWPLVLAFWSLPVALTALAVLVFTRHEPRARDAPPVRWWPDWRNALTWRLGLIFGCASLSYFGTNAFVPDYLKATHHAALTTAALTSLNLSQLPASLLTALLPGLLVARRWPLAAAGGVTLLAATGFALGGSWVVVLAGALGFSTALVFVLTMALPPLLADEHDVHRLTAAIFTITYACPFAGSFLGGAIWDATGIPVTAFSAVAAAGLLILAMVGGLDLSHARHEMPAG
ncbi:MAG: MFS transporter [Chloroflexota bacterium]|nr:MFS transporter [Chloroflexota bacterium]